jgi:hypothetical protein
MAVRCRVPFIALLTACSAQPPPKVETKAPVSSAAPAARAPATPVATPSASAAAPPASAAAAPASPPAPLNYYDAPEGSEPLFRVRETLKAGRDGSEYLALADGFVELAEDAKSTTARSFAAGPNKPAQLFKLPAPLSYSDAQVDPAGQRIAVVVGREQNSLGDLYVWGKKAGLRRLLASTPQRRLEKGFLRWTPDGKWLGLASLERPCDDREECLRGLVLDATTGAVKYVTPAELGSGQLTFNAERGFICGTLDSNFGELAYNSIGLSGFGQPRAELTADEKRDRCRWYELSLATGQVTRGGPPVFSSPDGKFRVRVEALELAITPNDGSAPYRLRVFESDQLIWFSDHELELRGYAFDLAARTSRELSPDDFRFMVLSYDRRSALLQRYTTGNDRGEIVVAERR